jgi:hypothetical protein
VPCQITQQPKGGPQTTNVRFSGQCDSGFDNATRHTKLVPCLQHGTSKVFGHVRSPQFDVVEAYNLGICCFAGDYEFSVGISYGILWCVIMQGVVGVIILIQGRPTGIGAIVKAPVGCVEFIRKNELKNSIWIKGWVSGR